MVRLATAQSFIDKNVETNSTEIQSLMQRASDEGANIIHFPEGALSGYSKDEVKNWQSFDWPTIHDQMPKICRAARDLDLWVVLGSTHQLTSPNRPHNSLYIISNNGEIHTRYDKRFCSYNEIMNWYTPGRYPCVFEVCGIRFGCVLCIEIQFPELFTEYLRDDVHCVLFSAYDKSTMFATQAQGYAASCSYWVSYSIPTNTSKNTSSKLIAPTGEIISSCRHNVSDLVVNTIDMEAPQWDVPLTKARPWRTKAREGSIYRERFVEDERSINKQIF